MDATDTAPFDAARAAADPDTPDAAGDDGGLVERLADAINRTVYAGGFHGPHVAAVRVLADHELRRALRAANVVRALSDRHRPVRWAPDSPTVVCSAGCGAYPCADRDILDGGLT